MKKQLLAILGGATLVAGGAVGAAFADPGPHHGNNRQGLCTAYYNGSANGQANKRKAPPFVALEKAADEAGDGDGVATAEEVAAFCDGFVMGRAGRGGSTPGGGRP